MTELKTINFVGFKMENVYASEGEGKRKLTIIAFPLKKTFKYKVEYEKEILFLGSSLEEAIEEYNQIVLTNL